MIDWVLAGIIAGWMVTSCDILVLHDHFYNCLIAGSTVYILYISYHEYIPPDKDDGGSSDEGKDEGGTTDDKDEDDEELYNIYRRRLLPISNDQINKCMTQIRAKTTHCTDDIHEFECSICNCDYETILPCIDRDHMFRCIRCNHYKEDLVVMETPDLVVMETPDLVVMETPDLVVMTKCFACDGTRTTYWTDDYYGVCFECCCIDCNKLLGECVCKYYNKNMSRDVKQAEKCDHTMYTVVVGYDDKHKKCSKCGCVAF